MTLNLHLYRVVTGALEALVPAVLRARAARGKEDAARLGERLGRASQARPDGPLVWLHGASVGESLSILPLVARLRTQRPDAAVLVTSGTVASAHLLAQRLPAGVIHQYLPVDTPRAAGRFLDHWRPDLAVFVESELWPNLLLQAKASGARLALVSAKLSDRSFARWRRRPVAAARLLGGFDLILAQDARAAERIAALGGTVTGEADLKFGADPLPADPAELERMRVWKGERPLVLAASTHPGEDELILDAVIGMDAKVWLVIVPRHPARGPAILDAAQTRGLRVCRRGDEAEDTADVLVADTLGELGLWYRLADLALVAGSLVPGIGGHNPLEPARLACPILAGPYVDNWLSAYRDLAAVDGLARVKDDDLAVCLDDLLADPQTRAGQAARAKALVDARDAEARAGLGRIVDLVP
ncbi:MAG: Three-deoxy-D-manno-octulosonic-acid transferase domain protein [Caulobacter sp.]|nr:Three-deoxy-D-manno-octulosonic-acid transferase domain protein [Caulobacter sp.]